MGYGGYSIEDREVRATASGYYTKSVHEVTSRRLDEKMNPSGVHLRESKDSEEHPNTTSLIIGLDLTGSMYGVPAHLVKHGLPNIMSKIIQNGIKDPQVLFLGIGDHECDDSPLQIGQFESSDELLDKWLTSVWLEGGGGGNGGESYLLAWYFAGFHTKLDSLEKRNKKGILVTIGDEPNLKSIKGNDLKNIMGGGQFSDVYSSNELLKKAKEKYDVYHIHVNDTSRGANQNTINGWKEILGDNFIILDNHELISKIIPKLVADHNNGNNSEILLDNENKSSDEEIML